MYSASKHSTITEKIYGYSVYMTKPARNDSHRHTSNTRPDSTCLIHLRHVSTDKKQARDDDQVNQERI